MQRKSAKAHQLKQVRKWHGGEKNSLTFECKQATDNWVGEVGECLNRPFELSSRNLLLAGCSLYGLAVNFGNTWTE